MGKGQEDYVMKKVVLSVFVVSALVMTSVSMAMTCEKGSDCTMSECCLLNVTTSLGYCEPMRKTSWSCYVYQPYAWSKPEAMVADYDLCPCAVGEFCGPLQGESHPKYGSMGMCMFG